MATQPGMETTLRAAVAERLGESRYGLWFGEGVRLGVLDDSLEVGVPNAFFRDWIQGHFAGNLVEAAREVTGRSLRLAFRVDGEAEPPLGHVIEGPPPDANDRPTGPTIPVPLPPPPIDRPKAQAPSPAPSAPSRPSRRLDDFVTGTGNRLAHAASLELVQSGGGSFNPLVIQGGVGLGKTHLLEGIGAALRARHPGMKVVHLTAEGFTNGFLDAMRHGTLTSFRSRYRGAGALLVDDVHFLAAKKATQGRVPPHLQRPDFRRCPDHPDRRPASPTDRQADRRAGHEVPRRDGRQARRPRPRNPPRDPQGQGRRPRGDRPEAVLAYVADHLRASVRELEGALHSLIAHATMTGKKLDLALAKAALRDTIRHTARAVALKDVEKAVCHLFGIDPEALKADNRARAVAYPRMLAMYLGRKHTGAAYSEIGRFFGGRNHSTVISAEKKVQGWLKDEARNGLLAGFETMGDILHSLEQTLGA